MRLKTSLYLSVAAIGVAVLLSTPAAQLRAQQSAPPGVSVGDGDLGGVVSGPNGPEAGVWVIAETTDLPTRFAKIVVTDDQGRYVLPELPKANYNVWVRGYGLVDSPKVATAPGKILNLTAVPAPSAAAAAEYYPAIYWYSMLKVPDKSEFPGTGSARQRHADQHQKPGAVARRGQDQWLLHLPPARQQGDAHDPEGFRRHEAGRSLGAAHHVRPGAGADGECHGPPRRAARAQAVRGLDRPDRRGRTAGRETGAPAGRRAQRRHLGVGLVRSEGVSARPDLDRQAQAHGQRLRKGLRIDGGQHRLLPRARSQGARGDRDQDAGARSEDADIQEQQHGAFALLG